MKCAREIIEVGKMYPVARNYIDFAARQNDSSDRYVAYDGRLEIRVDVEQSERVETRTSGGEKATVPSRTIGSRFI